MAKFRLAESRLEYRSDKIIDNIPFDNVSYISMDDSTHSLNIITPKGTNISVNNHNSLNTVKPGKHLIVIDSPDYKIGQDNKVLGLEINIKNECAYNLIYHQNQQLGSPSITGSILSSGLVFNVQDNHLCMAR